MTDIMNFEANTNATEESHYVGPWRTVFRKSTLKREKMKETRKDKKEKKEVDEDDRRHTTPNGYTYSDQMLSGNGLVFVKEEILEKHKEEKEAKAVLSAQSYQEAKNKKLSNGESVPKEVFDPLYIQKVVQKREQNKWTQTKLANEMMIGEDIVSKLEKGELDYDPLVVQKIARVLKFSANARKTIK